MITNFQKTKLIFYLKQTKFLFILKNQSQEILFSILQIFLYFLILEKRTPVQPNIFLIFSKRPKDNILTFVNATKLSKQFKIRLYHNNVNWYENIIGMIVLISLCHNIKL